MLDIIENDIYLTRGDYATFKISGIVDDTSPPEAYTFKAGEKVKFTVKKSSHDTNELISKELTVAADTEEVEISLDPEDTKKLKFGIHRYDVQLTHLNGRPDTIVPSALFKVGDEIG